MGILAKILDVLGTSGSLLLDVFIEIIKFVPKWRNWQTHGTQNPAVAISCRFDSDLRHSPTPFPLRSGSYGGQDVATKSRPSFLNGCQKGFSMLDSSCIFCKIIQGSIPSVVVKENEYITVIKNIAPKAPVHYLIIPKKHLADVAALTDSDKEFGWQMLKIAAEISKDEKLQGFNLVANNGHAAGQSVFHLHFHFISGKNLYSGGFTL